MRCCAGWRKLKVREGKPAGEASGMMNGKPAGEALGIMNGKPAGKVSGIMEGQGNRSGI